MRVVVCGVVAAGLLIGQASAASAIQSCARPVEKSAFDIAGLKSQLMVTALSCAVQDRYNAFITRFRGNLVAQEKTLTGYFGRAYGRRGQSQHDDYVTSLANQQSEEGTKLGSDFCRRKVLMFDEVMALDKPTDLSSYAAGKSMLQPIALVYCPIATASAKTSHGPASGKKKKTQRS